MADTDHKALPDFIAKHQWFCREGGHILFKTAGSITPEAGHLIETAGCIFAQSEDSSVYDAWNQAMDILENQHLNVEDYVAFIGMDDELREEFCLAIAKLPRPPNPTDFIYGNAQYHFKGRYKNIITPDRPKLFGQDNYLFDIPHPGMMNRWGTIRESRFDTSYQLAADFDFYIGIAHTTNVSHQKIQTIQATIGADGMSNSIEALEIYPREWSMIAANRQVHLTVPGFKIALFRKIANFPMIFHLLRRIAWKVKGKSPGL